MKKGKSYKSLYLPAWTIVAAVGPMLLGAVEIGSRKALLAGMDFQVASQLRPWWKVQGKLPEEEGVLAGVLGYLLGLGATKIALLFFAAGGGHAGHGIALPVDPWLAGAALALAIVLGLGSSFYPARVAARLDPCEALRAL